MLMLPILSSHVHARTHNSIRSHQYRLSPTTRTHSTINRTPQQTFRNKTYSTHNNTSKYSTTKKEAFRPRTTTQITKTFGSKFKHNNTQIKHQKPRKEFRNRPHRHNYRPSPPFRPHRCSNYYNRPFVILPSSYTYTSISTSPDPYYSEFSLEELALITQKRLQDSLLEEYSKMSIKESFEIKVEILTYKIKTDNYLHAKVQALLTYSNRQIKITAEATEYSIDLLVDALKRQIIKSTPML